jgi:uncharacterized protein
MLLATPTVLYAIAWGVAEALGVGSPTAGPSEVELPPEIMELFAAMGTGGIWDALIGNLILLVGRWVDLFVTMRFPKVFGMFLLGLWVLRQEIATAPERHTERLTRWALWGLAVGVATNLAGAWAFEGAPYWPPSGRGALGVLAQGLGFPMLAIGYASAVTVLCVRGSRVLSMFAPVGRMALTNYLTHSVVCSVLSYGFGAGLFWRIGVAQAWTIAVGIIAVQVPLSAWWMRHYQVGPAEWVWRRLTYQQPLPLRRR